MTDDLMYACKKFLDKNWSLEEFCQTISYMLGSNDYPNFEYNLEKIRFCVSKGEQFNLVKLEIYKIFPELIERCDV